MELTAAPLAVGYALGRVGCFLVNDDSGIPSSLPWAMKFPEGLPHSTVAELTSMHVQFPPGTDPGQLVAVHPTQIYETALMLAAFWLLWRLPRHPHAIGWRFGVYLVLARVERFLIGVVPAKDDRLLGPFTLAQATSALLVLAGIVTPRQVHAPEAAAARAGRPAPAGGRPHTRVRQPGDPPPRDQDRRVVEHRARAPEEGLGRPLPGEAGDRQVPAGGRPGAGGQPGGDGGGPAARPR